MYVSKISYKCCDIKAVTDEVYKYEHASYLLIVVTTILYNMFDRFVA